MIPFYYRAIRYSWNEDRYRTPGVDSAKGVTSIGSDEVTLSPQVLPEPIPVKGKAAAPEGKAGEAAEGSPAIADRFFLLGQGDSPWEFPQHPFQISSRWSAAQAVKALRQPNFLVAVDAWALQQGILAAAESLAKEYSARVLFLHIQGPDATAEAEDGLLRQIEGFPQGYEFHSIRASAPAAALLQEAQAQNAALLLLATHGRQGKERVLTGSVSEDVFKQADIPVLVHRPGTSWPRLQNILVPFADLRGAWGAIGRAALLSRSFGAELWLFHVREKAVASSKEEQDWENTLAGLAASHSELREVEAEGGVAAAITAFATREGVQLIVLPSHREDLSKKILPGGISSQVLREAPCSVLGVPV
ncbi:MAG: universal stress protein [bacterium]